jgi:hypothetical protein
MNEIKGSWCEISHEFYDEDWLNDDKSFRKNYIGSLIKLREIMHEE